jgi:hypothetical protein
MIDVSEADAGDRLASRNQVTDRKALQSQSRRAGRSPPLLSKPAIVATSAKAF